MEISQERKLPGQPQARTASGVELIIAERKRQLMVEGWTAEHDDEHSIGQLAKAAACYALVAAYDAEHVHNPDWILGLWPWSYKWWRPSGSDQIRNLVKAGALIAAEIDRLQRKSK